jgi:hypothetical protein
VRMTLSEQRLDRRCRCPGLTVGCSHRLVLCQEVCRVKDICRRHRHRRLRVPLSSVSFVSSASVELL